MAPPIRVLLVEDSEEDAALVLHQLQGAGLDVVSERVASARELRRALAESQWDVVISDYSMPQFDGLKAATIVRSIDSDLPFIFVSGALGAQRAVRAMSSGVRDYLAKGNLDRLPAVVDREARGATARREGRSARMEAHEYGDAIVAAIQWPLLVVDRSWRVLTANPAFRRSFGVDGSASVERLLEMIQNASSLRDQLIDVIERGEEIEDLELHIALPSGPKSFLLSARRILPRSDKEQPAALLVLR